MTRALSLSIPLAVVLPSTQELTFCVQLCPVWPDFLGDSGRSSRLWPSCHDVHVVSARKMTYTTCTDDLNDYVWSSHLIIIFVMAILNTLGSAFIMWTWVSNKVLRSKRALRHIAYKSIASVIMASSYLISYNGYVSQATWQCDLQGAMQAITSPTVLVSEVAIALEIVRIVNNIVLARTPRAAMLEEDRGCFGLVLWLLYPVFVVWGIVATIVPFFVPRGVGSYAPGAGQFCWFDLFWERLAFFYVIEMACVLIIVGVLIWLHVQLSLQKDITCMGTTLGLLRTLSCVYIFTWTPPLVQRLSEELEWGLECNPWFEYLWDFTITGGGFVDALIWFRFPVVKAEMCSSSDSSWAGGTSLHRWAQGFERPSSLHWFSQLLAGSRSDQTPEGDHPYHSLYDSSQFSEVGAGSGEPTGTPGTVPNFMSPGPLESERRESEMSLNTATTEDIQGIVVDSSMLLQSTAI